MSESRRPCCRDAMVRGVLGLMGEAGSEDPGVQGHGPLVWLTGGGSGDRVQVATRPTHRYVWGLHEGCWLVRPW